MDIRTSFKIGYIAKSRGLRGEVTVIFSEPVLPEANEALFLERDGSLVPYTIESISSRPDKSFIKFEDINTVADAEALRGCSIYLPKDIRPELKRGEFYNDEIIGFKVEDKNHGELGTIKDILESGPSRLIQILDGNGKEILIPVQGPFITSLNRSKKLLKVDLPDGFLEI